MLQISIILPAYNEKLNLKALIPNIGKILSNYNFEIIVIDDASSDGTGQALADFNIIFKHNEKREGLGKSIKRGIEMAKGEFIFVMDSDGDHNPLNLTQMLEGLKCNDMVINSRFKKRSLEDSRLRRRLSKGFNYFVRIMTKGSLTDYLYGYWCAKKSALEKINFDEIFWGYGDYSIRLLFYLEKLNLKILEIPSIPGNRRFGSGNLRFLKTFSQYTFSVILLTLKERIFCVSKDKTLSNLQRS